ncbi:MAG: aldehyde dehydrogenase family protein [Gammaproteobacteria bacterium]|nr:aldehyde dehydrogenase family protein [Gammaproteobacteria bacterium]
MSQDIAVRNPYTGELDYSFIEPTPQQLAATCERLRTGQLEWTGRPLEARLEALQHLGEVIAKHAGDLTTALTLDTGRAQVPAIEVAGLQAQIERAQREASQALAPTAPRPAQIPLIHGSANRKPLGLVGNISPWNFPIILSFIDTFPALAAGNAVIIKPSEITPRWVEPMRAAIAECPDIAAVLDIALGTGETGAAIPGLVDAVVFTGSVATGRKVGEAAARHFIPAALELGGKDPAVVLPSAEIDYAAKVITFSSVQSTGQACQSLERAYVPAEHFDRFLRQAISTAESLELNYPDINRGVIGPFIFEQQAHKVLEQITDAVANGATLHCGGEIIDNGGLWMRPTVLTGVTHDMLIMREETFGPVVPIVSYDSVEEAVRLANDSLYGLSAAVFAGTTDEGREFAARLNAGAVSVNDAALTAVINEFEHDSFGFSGMGRSRAGLSAYTRFTREQAIMSNEQNQPLLASQLLD